MKTMTTYTPGPWEHEDFASVYSKDGGRHIAEVVFKEDATLIAAAPELLEALKEEHKLVDPDCEGKCQTAKLIAKAEGHK